MQLLVYGQRRKILFYHILKALFCYVIKQNVPKEFDHTKLEFFFHHKRPYDLSTYMLEQNWVILPRIDVKLSESTWFNKVDPKVSI